MTVNPVDMQVILPQSAQVSKLSRGLQFQQQVEQQVLTQQVQEEMRRQESQVKKTDNVKGNKVENEKNKQSQGGHYELTQDGKPQSGGKEESTRCV